jgi:hypothetical protein
MEASQNNIRIYSFYYHPFSPLKTSKIYVPVWAGKNGRKTKNGFIGDDSGEHISNKNKYYSELSGIYWVWKNTSVNIVGTCHYRRYFTQKKEPFLHQIKRVLYYPAGLWKKRVGLIYTGNINYWQKFILQENEINALLNKYDIILPTRRILRQSIKKHYEKYHNSQDLILLNEILNEFFPEYKSSFQQVINGHRLFANNMFIMKNDKFQQLMEWLFFILFTFEKRSNLGHYSGYQERIFGFLSERLITLWIVHNQLNYKELNLIYFKKLKQKQDA